MYLKHIILKATTHIIICKGNPQTKCGFHLQFADSTYNLRIPQQLNLTIQFFYHLYVDSTKFSGFRKYSCGFRKLAYFSSDFERYNDLGICLWNPKQHRRSNKSSNVADSATNLILACCGFHSQCRECTVWPRIGKNTMSNQKISCGFTDNAINLRGKLMIAIF